MKLLGRLSQIFVETPYDTMKYRYRQFSLVFGIVSAMLYLAFAIVSLTMRNALGEITSWLIIALTILTTIIILLLFRMNTSKMRYKKKNYALITKNLRKIIKLLVLITPIAILLKGRALGSGFELGLKIYSIIHIIIISITFIVSLVKLYYRISRRHKYYEREQKGYVSKTERIVLIAQEILKYTLTNKEENAPEIEANNDNTLTEKV